MTLTEFSEKYGVSNTLVIEAAGQMFPADTEDYDELILYSVVEEKIWEKIRETQKKIEFYQRTIRHMDNALWLEEHKRRENRTDG